MPTKASAAPTRAAGRPRDPAVDESILRATRELLAADGYRFLSVDGIAKRAGVSRTTLRLRWKSKAELVFDAVSPDTVKFAVPDGGDLESDLAACVANAVSFFRSASLGGAFQGLVEDCRHQPKVRTALLERVNAPTVLGYESMLSRARERGEAGPGIDAQAVLDIVAGAVLYRASVSVLDLTELEQHLVGLLAAGIRATGSGNHKSASTRRRVAADKTGD